VRLAAALAAIISIDRFNPRTREGCDFISSPTILASDIGFNPRTREGCDMNYYANGCSSLIEFQSTHP